jgi:hypothetical protein
MGTAKFFENPRCSALRGDDCAAGERNTLYHAEVSLPRGVTHSHGSTMTGDRDKAEGRAGHPAKKDARRDRLKQALRENLKRRKSQARGRSDIAPVPPADEPAAPHGRGGEKPGE